MTFGNLVAVWQTNLKRLLAYSSIAHAGYMLMGVVVMTDAGVASILIYFVVYMFMNLGAFFVIMLFANKIGSEELDDYTGIGYRSPVLAVSMVIFLISLTGIPPTAGFIGKWYLFIAVIEANYIWLAVVAVLNSVVSLFYYAKIIRNMFLRGVDKEYEALSFSPMSIVLLLILVIPTLVLGIWYGPLLDWANKSVGLFLGN
jgi:NADH-quinone oxidoreductase subunit N